MGLTSSMSIQAIKYSETLDTLERVNYFRDGKRDTGTQLSRLSSRFLLTRNVDFGRRSVGQKTPMM